MAIQRKHVKIHANKLCGITHHSAMVNTAKLSSSSSRTRQILHKICSPWTNHFRADFSEPHTLMKTYRSAGVKDHWLAFFSKLFKPSISIHLACKLALAKILQWFCCCCCSCRSMPMTSKTDKSKLFLNIFCFCACKWVMPAFVRDLSFNIFHSYGTLEPCFYFHFSEKNTFYEYTTLNHV